MGPLLPPHASLPPRGSHGVWLHKEDGVRSEGEEDGDEDEDWG